MDFSFGPGFLDGGTIFNADPTGSGGTPPAPHISSDSGNGGFFTNLINKAAGAFQIYENAQAVNDFNKARLNAGLYPVTGTQYFGSGSLGGTNLGSLMILLVVVVVIVAVIGAVSHR